MVKGAPYSNQPDAVVVLARLRPGLGKEGSIYAMY